MSESEETAIEELQRVRQHHSDKKQKAMNEEDETASAYHSGQIMALTYAIEVIQHE